MLFTIFYLSAVEVVCASRSASHSVATALNKRVAGQWAYPACVRGRGLNAYGTTGVCQAGVVIQAGDTSVRSISTVAKTATGYQCTKRVGVPGSLLTQTSWNRAGQASQSVGTVDITYSKPVLLSTVQDIVGSWIYTFDAGSPAAAGFKVFLSSSLSGPIVCEIHIWWNTKSAGGDFADSYADIIGDVRVNDWDYELQQGTITSASGQSYPTFSFKSYVQYDEGTSIHESLLEFIHHLQGRALLPHGADFLHSITAHAQLYPQNNEHVVGYYKVECYDLQVKLLKQV